MDEQIAWWVELAIKPGRLSDFESLTGEMVAATRKEQEALSYARFVNDEGTVVHVYERYASSAAAEAHLRAFFTTFGERYAGMVERRRFVVWGRPSDELRRMLNGFSATYLRPLGPFAYWL